MELSKKVLKFKFEKDQLFDLRWLLYVIVVFNWINKDKLRGFPFLAPSELYKRRCLSVGSKVIMHFISKVSMDNWWIDQLLMVIDGLIHEWINFIVIEWVFLDFVTFLCTYFTDRLINTFQKQLYIHFFFLFFHFFILHHLIA